MEMDLKFIQRAEKVTSFNIPPRDFESLEHKKEIQHLFNKHYFPKFDINTTIDGVDEQKLNRLISKLRAQDANMLKSLHKYNLKGVGPGEVLLYFLINDAYLGGGSSAGADLFVKSSGTFEVKSVDVTLDNFAINFKTGGTFNTSDLVTRAIALKKEAGAGTTSEVNKTNIARIKSAMPEAWATLEKDYVKRVYDNYFKKHKFIFMRNSTTKMGDILAIKEVKEKDIFFERVTSGVIKPKVKL